MSKYNKQTLESASASDEEVEGNLSFPFGKNGASEKCCNCAADSLTAKKEQRNKRQAALDQKPISTAAAASSSTSSYSSISDERYIDLQLYTVLEYHTYSSNHTDNTRTVALIDSDR